MWVLQLFRYVWVLIKGASYTKSIYLKSVLIQLAQNDQFLDRLSLYQYSEIQHISNIITSTSYPGHNSELGLLALNYNPCYVAT